MLCTNSYAHYEIDVENAFARVRKMVEDSSNKNAQIAFEKLVGEKKQIKKSKPSDIDELVFRLKCSATPGCRGEKNRQEAEKIAHDPRFKKKRQENFQKTEEVISFQLKNCEKETCLNALIALIAIYSVEEQIKS